MRDRDARVAGLLYLVAVAGGLFDLQYIPARFNVLGNAAATAHNILANEFLFRLGIVADLVLGIVWLCVVLALYQLLKDVDRIQAYLMLILGALLQVPLYYVNVVNRVAALVLVTNNDFVTAFSVAQRDALAMLFLRFYHYQLLSSFVFAGLWLIPFGILIYKSQIYPRLLGVWLVVNGFAYLAICIVGFLAPQYSDLLDNITQPILFGEIAIMLWLLIFGAKKISFPYRRVKRIV
ncbi:MAG TPA: DUF4386 domain-containing protein [Candidatus Cybelea sp.]|nr:DUF4386 domain-containing protein [Candidatus Cybelea sp.]